MRQREHEPAHDERPGHEEQQPRVALAAARERRRLGLLVNDAEGGGADFLYVLLEVVEVLLHLHLDRLVNLLAEAADAGRKREARREREREIESKREGERERERERER